MIDKCIHQWMSRGALVLSLCAATALGARRSSAQSAVGDHAIVIREPDDRSGPRAGVAYLIGGSVTEERAGKTISPLMSLFGWQIEHAFYAGDNLPMPVTELVLLVGGLEQNRPLPSASWLFGVRVPNGVEVGVGPTITGAGTQVALAGGITHQRGEINVPVNLAVVPGRRGASISITGGFNYRR
jgi:hypothetical protein